MNNKQVILGVENFKFSILDSVPKPEHGIAYILYNSNGRKDHILIITPQNPVLGSQIRAGKYDKKMIISTTDRTYTVSKTILDETGKFRFFINIDFLYRMGDIKYIFENDLWSFDDTIENKTLQIIEMKHKQYDIESWVELERDLRTEISEAVNQIGYLQINNFRITIKLDETAEKIIQSKLDTMADIILQEDDKERASVKISTQEDLEIQKLKAERNIEEERNKVLVEKAKIANALKGEMGDEHIALLAYVKGEISSVELDDRIRGNRNADRMAKIEVLKQMAELGVSERILDKATIKLLGQMDEDTEQNIHTINEEEDVVVEDTEEY